LRCKNGQDERQSNTQRLEGEMGLLMLIKRFFGKNKEKGLLFWARRIYSYGLKDMPCRTGPFKKVKS
jgi:hypothetical protein